MIEERVAVSWWNWRLFRCIFWSHCCVWSAVSLNAKGGAHGWFVDAWISNESVKRVWAPPSTEVQRYVALNTTKWSKFRNGIIFYFYTGLLHVWKELFWSAHVCACRCVWPLPPWQPDTSWPNIVTCRHIRTFFHGQCLHRTETSPHYRPFIYLIMAHYAPSLVL